MSNLDWRLTSIVNVVFHALHLIYYHFSGPQEEDSLYSIIFSVLLGYTLVVTLFSAYFMDSYKKESFANNYTIKQVSSL